MTPSDQLLAEMFLAEGLVGSVISAIGATIAALLLSLLVAYALPRTHTAEHGAKVGLFVPLMFAATVVLLPLFLILLRSNILVPGVALIIGYAFAVVPFCVWKLNCSLNRISAELKDAARIDGCSAGQVFRHVVLPGIAPNLVVTLIYSLIGAWSLCVVTPSILQLPGSPVLLRQSDGSNSGAAFIAAAPLVFLFLVLIGYLVRHARINSQPGTP